MVDVSQYTRVKSKKGGRMKEGRENHKSPVEYTKVITLSILLSCRKLKSEGTALKKDISVKGKTCNLFQN